MLAIDNNLSFKINLIVFVVIKTHLQLITKSHAVNNTITFLCFKYEIKGK